VSESAGVTSNEIRDHSRWTKVRRVGEYAWNLEIPNFNLTTNTNLRNRIIFREDRSSCLPRLFDIRC